jgi:hypothetical protein
MCNHINGFLVTQKTALKINIGNNVRHQNKKNTQLQQQSPNLLNKLDNKTM